MNALVTCGACGLQLQAPVDQPHASPYPCPRCRQPIGAPPSYPYPVPPLVVTCPHCRNAMSCDPRLAGHVVACPYCRVPVATPGGPPPPPAPEPQPADDFEEIGNAPEPNRSRRDREPRAKGGFPWAAVAFGMLLTGALVAGGVFLFGLVTPNNGPGTRTTDDLPPSPVDGILDKLEAGKKRTRELQQKVFNGQAEVDAAVADAERAEAASRRFGGLSKDSMDLINDAQKARWRVSELTPKHLADVTALNEQERKMTELGADFLREYQREKDRVELLPVNQRQPALDRLARWWQRYHIAKP